ncbi:HAMP domain-containing sensor histidine kinase [Myxococcus sp. RHSTA-1-4]|uniref:sensor histidine kinase n=1 Tax=Myxococcus sp. RHSTA-1-4 TaxID=2874601 RepID=UPI001CC13584|nr:ATP-binding protein [Myxococcus sp. RHSTA-1-4]MBZ4421273.1 HAMP domain-containing histidine kinase [Myxococcus sp. RHSTA-1-4]
MSLRARLIVLVLGLTALLLGGLGLYLSRALTTWSQEVLDAELAHRADVLSSEVEWHHGEISVEDEVEALAQGWPWRIETLDGRVLASSRFTMPGLAGLGGTGAPFQTIEAPGGAMLRVLSRTFEPHHGRGERLVLRVAAPLSTFARVAERFRVGLLVALALAAVLGGLGAAALAQMFLSPLRRLSREVSGIEERSLSTRLQTQGLDPELRRLAAAFNGVLGRLEQAFEGQRAFVGRASHALRTPLASILSQAEVTLRRERSPEEYRAALTEIAHAARESASLAQGLLALNRADAAKGEARRERIVAAELANEVLHLFRARAEEAGLLLRSEAEEGLELHADRGRLREMLDALMDNALRYTPRGGRVRFDARAEGEEAVLEVSDTGLGIAPDERDKVTERFFRGSAAQKTAQAGSGLGLSVVQALAQAEGARLSIEDAPGGGTRVSLRFLRAGS